MSKAFLRESDSDELPDLPRPASLLPPGAKNLMTAAGAERLRADLRRWLEVERPPLAARVADDADARRELQAHDRRIRHLQTSLQSAEIVAPAVGPHDVVRFGDTVTVRERDGMLKRYQIVGTDETDGHDEAVSWQSPLARALVNARVGARVVLRAPGGNRELEIVAIA